MKNWYKIAEEDSLRYDSTLDKNFPTILNWEEQDLIDTIMAFFKKVNYHKETALNQVEWLVNKRLKNETPVRKDNLIALINHKITNYKYNPLDGKTNEQAKKFVRKNIDDLTKGFFRDQDWSGINKIFKKFHDLELDWIMKDTQYQHNENNVPTSKMWRIEIYFTNNNNRKTTLYGTVTAHGAGSVEDPLDRYDITAIL